MPTSLPLTQGRTRKRWESAFDDAAIGMALVGLDGSWIDVNRALCRILDYPREELLRRTFQEITHPHDLSTDHVQLLRLLQGDVPAYELEMRYFRGDGTTIWCNHTSSLACMEDGTPEHVILQIQDITQRKDTEERLSVSEARYRALYEESVDGIFVVDRYGRIVSANPAFGEFVPWEAELAIVDLRLTDLIHSGENRIRIAEALRFGTSLRDVRDSVKRGDGGRIPVSINVRPQRVGEGGEPLFQGRITDLTEEVSAALNERRLGALVNSSSDAIIATDLLGQILAWNAAAERLFGYQTDEVLGRPISIIAPTFAPDEDARLADRAAHSEPIIGYETQRLHANGEPVDVSLTISPIHDDRDEVAGFSIIARDIRERRRAEARVRASEGRLRRIVAAQQGVAGVRLEREAVMEMIARQAMEITGASGSAVLQQLPDETFAFAAGLGSLAGLDALRLNPERSLAGLCAKTGATVYSPDTPNDPRADRRVTEMAGVGSMALVSLRDRNGTSAILEVASDEPDAFAEYDLHSLELMAGFLAGAIRDANAFKRQRELLEERETYASELERSNVALHEFASIASHDLQEPLRKVRAFGDRLVNGYAQLLDDKGRDYLDRMQSAAARMQSLIDDLLNYSRVTTKAQPFEAADLAEVVNGVLQDLSLRIDQTDAVVAVQPLPTIDADPTQMRQLFQNLVANALKFQKSDERPEINITNVVDADSVTLRVADNGIGFNPDFTAQIFRPFERLHPRSRYEGTGMGLAICRRIVERHGGWIRANSSPGEGATFEIKLPRKQWRR